LRILFMSSAVKVETMYHHRYDVICSAICQDRKHTAQVIHVDPTTGVFDDGIINAADVIVLHADILSSTYKLIQKWKASGKVVIADLCKPVWFDEMGSMKWVDGDTGRFTRELFTQKSIQSNAQLFRWGIRLVDAVISNSNRMIEDWGGKTPIYYLPDFIPLDEYLIHPPEPHDGVVVGLKLLKNGLQKSVESGLYDAIEAIGREKPEARFLFYGDQIQLYRNINLNPHQKLYIPIRSINDWQKLLSTIDIGVIPLSGVEDDRSGWFDALEYMVMKIPWVASENQAFYDIKQYGWLVKNHSKIWERVLMDMIGNLTAYKEDTFGEPYLFAIGMGIDEYIEKLYNIIISVQDSQKTREMVINDSSNHISNK